MFRDRYKNVNYFEEAQHFVKEMFEDFEGMKTKLSPEKLKHFYLVQSVQSLKLVKIDYSLGNPNKEIFKWFKISLHYYSLVYTENDGISTIIDYLSLAVLFSFRKEEFLDDVKVIFDKYNSFVDRGEEFVQDHFIETLALYLLEDKEYPFHSHLEYLNMIADSADSVIEAQKFWYYAHSDVSWYGTHKSDHAYFGYWSFDRAALCKMRGIYDQRFKELDFFPYDLLVQE